MVTGFNSIRVDQCAKNLPSFDVLLSSLVQSLIAVALRLARDSSFSHVGMDATAAALSALRQLRPPALDLVALPRLCHTFLNDRGLAVAVVDEGLYQSSFCSSSLDLGQFGTLARKCSDMSRPCAIRFISFVILLGRRPRRTVAGSIRSLLGAPSRMRCFHDGRV